jgi:hypothetical protein
MRTAILFVSIALFTTQIFAIVPGKKASGEKVQRKVSNSHYYSCMVEREGKDRKNFKRVHHFPYPQESGETYELKGSLRWNSYQLSFDNKGTVEIVVSEQFDGGAVKGTKSHKLGKEPHFENLKTKVDLKHGNSVVSYLFQCGPE